MGLVWVREQWNKRMGSGNERSVREYVRSWLVLRDSPLDDSFQVLASSGLPVLFTPYIGSDGVADTLGALLKKLEAHQPDRDQPFLWEVTANYGNVLDPVLGDPNPLDRPTEISLDYDRFQVPLTIDLFGAPVLNSVNEAFDPPVEKDDSRPTLTMTRNELAAPDAIAAAYKDVCNSDAWFGQPSYMWKCGGIKYQRAYENDVLYWKVTYIFHLNPKSWDSRVLDRGTHWIGDDGVTPTRFRAADGSLLETSLLNGEGKPLGKVDSAHAGAVGVLTAAMAATDTTVFSTGGAPAINWPVLVDTYPIVLKVDQELIQATAPRPGPGGSWTNVIRGYGGTTAATHASGATIAMQPYYLAFSPYPMLPFANLRLP